MGDIFVCSLAMHYSLLPNSSEKQCWLYLSKEKWIIITYWRRHKIERGGGDYGALTRPAGFKSGSRVPAEEQIGMEMMILVLGGANFIQCYLELVQWMFYVSKVDHILDNNRANRNLQYKIKNSLPPPSKEIFFKVVLKYRHWYLLFHRIMIYLQYTIRKARNG